MEKEEQAVCMFQYPKLTKKEEQLPMTVAFLRKKGTTPH